MNLFDQWNRVKQSLDQRKEVPHYKEREIWWCSIGQNIGHEENGRNQNFERPVLVLTKFNKWVFWGLSLTSKVKSGYFYHAYSLDGKKASAILSQLRLFDVKRLQRKLGSMQTQDFKVIKHRLKKML